MVEAVLGAARAFLGRPQNENCEDCLKNAVQHAYWTWKLAVAYGAERAKALTDGHENWSGNPGNRCADKGMDLSNNQAGLDMFLKNSKDGKPTISNAEALRRLVEMAQNGLLSANTLPN